MLNRVILRATFVSDPWGDNLNNLFITISVINDMPSSQVNGENRYGRENFTICIHPRLHQYFLNNWFKGQKVYLEGMIVGNSGDAMIVINQIDLLERKDNYIRKSNENGRRS
jgi:hypothetical protein